MRYATLTRNPSTDQGTFGTLVLDDGTRYVTGELPDRDNICGLSCIDEGEYRAIPYTSGHLGKVYWLQDVPGRTEVLIHVGNFCGDVKKGYKSDVLGCIIVGTYLNLLDGQQAVHNSLVAMTDLLDRLAGDDLTLTIQ